MKRDKSLTKHIKVETAIDYSSLCLEIDQCIENNKPKQAKELINNYNLPYAKYHYYSKKEFNVKSLNLFEDSDIFVKELERQIKISKKMIKFVPLAVASLGSFLFLIIFLAEGISFEEFFNRIAFIFSLYFFITFLILKLLIFKNHRKLKRIMKAINHEA